MTIPREFRFRSPFVSIRRDTQSGEIILSEVPSLEDVFAALDAADIPKDFLEEADRERQPPEDRPELHALFGEKADSQERP